MGTWRECSAASTGKSAVVARGQRQKVFGSEVESSRYVSMKLLEP